MKLSEWLHVDDVAIGYGEVHYGLPKYGHPDCYKTMQPSQQYGIQHVVDTPIIRTKCCIECGKLLLPAESEPTS